MTLRLALFDCDGTLVDSQHSIVACMGSAFAAEGLAPPDPAAVRRIVGLPLVGAIAALHPAGEPALHERIADHYRDAFTDNRSKPEYHEPLYPGCREALAALAEAGVLLGIATGKGSRGLRAILELHGLTPLFATLQTSDLAPGKPAPDMVLRALAATGVEREHAVVIGDTVFDVQMARNAKVPALGVAWGYHEPAELAEAGAVAVLTEYGAVPGAVLRQVGA
ncbi:MAG TPA: HAD-IA family hydrolase [Alphaproteobacteria bacterium]|nr:HAD-IA family hydrolase [Alphaproteobacteria bacterium]